LRLPDPEPTTPAAKGGARVSKGNRPRRGIHRVVAGHGKEKIGAVLDRAREGSRVVERPRQRHHARAARPAVRRLDPGEAAEGRGSADGAPGVRAGGARHQPGGEGGARAAARAAGNMVEIPRIARGGKLVSGKLDAEGELVGDELAEHHRSRL